MYSLLVSVVCRCVSRLCVYVCDCVFVCVGVYSSIMVLFTNPGGLRLTLILSSWKPFDLERTTLSSPHRYTPPPPTHPVSPKAGAASINSPPLCNLFIEEGKNGLCTMVYDVHCWSYFCISVFSSLNDSLVENNELFSWINWIEGDEALDLKLLSVDIQVQE